MKKKNQNKIMPVVSPAIPLKISVFGWAAIAWTIFVVYTYVQRDPIGPILSDSWHWWPSAAPTSAAVARHLSTLFFGFGILLGAMAIGFWLVRWISFLSRLGVLVCASVVGIGSLAYLIFLLGFLQLYRPLTFHLLFVLGLVLFFASFPFGLKNLMTDSVVELKAIVHKTPLLFLIPLFLVFLMGGLMIFVPECFYDSLVYHLGVPRWYLFEGGIKKFPNLHSNYPLTLQLLYLYGLAISGDSAAKLIHLFCGGLLTLLFGTWGFQRYKNSSGVLAAVFFLSMPMAQMVMWTTGVDLGTTLFAVAAVWIWQMRTDYKGTILSGVLAGLAFGSKLTGGVIILSVGLGLFMEHVIQKKNFLSFLRETFIFGLSVFLVALPWLVKAYVYTGNPVFPFLFGGLDSGRTAQFFAESKGVTPNGFWGWVTLLWPLTFEGLSSLSYPGVVFLAFIPVLFGLIILDDSFPLAEKNMVIAGLASMVVLAFVNRWLRYWMPYLAVVAIPMAWAVCRIQEQSVVKKLVVHLLVGFIAFSNVLYAGRMLFNSYLPWPVVLGQENIEDYKSYTHTGLNPYPSVKMTNWASQNLPKGSKVFFLGEEKVAFSQIPFLASGIYDVSLLLKWMESSKTTEELFASISREGITHFLVNLFEGKRLLGYRIFDWPEEKMIFFCQFWDAHVRLVHADFIPEKYDLKPPLFLYEVLPAAEAAKKPVPWNPVFWLFEEYHVPMENPDSKSQKLVWIQGLSERFPGNRFIYQRQQELTAQNRS